jgi:hypothetical protein
MHCIVPNNTLALYQNQERNGLEGDIKERKERRTKDQEQQQNHPRPPSPAKFQVQKRSALNYP